jgi:hypothetical protein
VKYRITVITDGKWYLEKKKHWYSGWQVVSKEEAEKLLNAKIN